MQPGQIWLARSTRQKPRSVTHPHELDTGERSRGDDASTVTFLGAPCDHLSLDVSYDSSGFLRTPAIERDNGLSDPCDDGAEEEKVTDQRQKSSSELMMAVWQSESCPAVVLLQMLYYRGRGVKSQLRVTQQGLGKPVQRRPNDDDPVEWDTKPQGQVYSLHSDVHVHHLQCQLGKAAERRSNDC